MEFDGHKFQKWLPKPLSFFMWDTEGDCLQALAVEVARGGRVFTPADRKKRGLLGRIPLLGGTSDDWLFAKICVGEQTASLYRSFRSQMLGYCCTVLSLHPGQQSSVYVPMRHIP